MMLNQIQHIDMFDGFDNIPDGFVDMVFADLPYGHSKNEWDIKIDLDKFWNNIFRVSKSNTPIILTSQGIFTAELMMSNKKYYRYTNIWKKGEKTTGFLNSNRIPLVNHEEITIYYKKLPIYNPQFTTGKPSHSKGNAHKHKNITNNNYGKFKSLDTNKSNLKYPKSIIVSDYNDYELEILVNSVLDFSPIPSPFFATLKPTSLMRHIIETYSDKNSVILDPCMGSGSTAKACIETGRNFIGFEKNRDIFFKHCDPINKGLYIPYTENKFKNNLNVF